MKSPKISIFRGLLLASIAISGMTVAAPVLAQDEAADAEDSGEIIVTARRREESLQDVPNRWHTLPFRQVRERC